MKKNLITKIYAMLVMTLVFMMVVACGNKAQENTQNNSNQAVTDATEADTTDAAGDGVEVLGEGEKVFAFTVVDKDGNETCFEIHTDKEMVGEALQELTLIEGEVSQYGLFVKSVNGIVADYDVDKTYWAFYINGEYAMTGVDATSVEDGAVYTFKPE